MSGNLTLERKSLITKITFQKRFPQYIGEIRNIWVHKKHQSSTRGDVSQTRYSFNQRYSFSTNVWELKSKIKILSEQGRMLYMKCILEVQSHVQIVKGREISLFFVLTC
jgi:hypothetical protein